MLKISIVTPSYNQGEFLEATVRSILAQNYSNLEYIICDGGSNDSSVEIIKKYSNQLAYWESQKDNGQAHAINKGFRRATGEIIGWINSDDILLPGALRRINDVFKNNPEIDVVYGNSVWIDKDGKVIRKRKNASFHYKTWLYGRADPLQPEVFYRRRVLEKAGYLNENFHMMLDREWWLRMAQQGCRFLYVDEEFSALRRHTGAKTHLLQKRNEQERWMLHDLYWEGFRFKNMMLHKFHWKFLIFFYRLSRRLRLLLKQKTIALK